MLRTEVRRSTSTEDMGTSLEGAANGVGVRLRELGYWWMLRETRLLEMRPYLADGSHARHLFLREVVGMKRGLGYLNRRKRH